MAMALKLRTIPIQTGAEGLPDFMVWNNVKSLPWFWEPFHSYDLRDRRRGPCPGHPVVPAGLLRLSCPRHRGLCRDHHAGAAGGGQPRSSSTGSAITGGFNGMTDLRTAGAFGLTFDPYSGATYYLIAISLAVALFLGLALITAKPG